MKTTSEILSKLQEFKAIYGSRYGIDSLLLFGSTARGMQTEDSDVDVAMHSNKMLDYFTVMDAKDKLQEILNTKVDLITLHDYMQPYFKQEIMRDAIYV